MIFLKKVGKKWSFSVSDALKTKLFKLIRMSKTDYTLPIGKIGSNKVEGFKNLQSIFKEHIWNESKKPIKDRVLKTITKEQLDNAKAENAVIGFHANYSLRRTEKVNYLTGIIVYDIDFIKDVDKVQASKEIDNIIEKALKPYQDNILLYYRTPSRGLKIAILVDYFGKEEDDFNVHSSDKCK